MNTRTKPCYSYIQKENGNSAIVYKYEGKNVIIVDDIKPGKLDSESSKLDRGFAKSKYTDYDEYMKFKAKKSLKAQGIDNRVIEILEQQKKFFKDRGLIAERVPNGTNVRVKSIKNGDIEFYSKVEELEEFIRLASRSDIEKVTSYKKVVNWSKTSSAKYGKEKVWTDGTKFKFSQHNVPPPPPVCVDFSHTPNVLYGGKAGKPAVVKIKLTGNDATDFKMAYKKSGLSPEEIKKIESGEWTWHHMDDYDPKTGECTMQLVDSAAHQFTCSHLGGAGLYKAYNGIGYPNRTTKKVI